MNGVKYYYDLILLNFNKLKKYICLILYYLIAQWLPPSHFIFIGRLSCKIRYVLVKNIFFKCGKNVNIERKVRFGSGRLIEIGDNSGIGLNAVIPNNIIIGDNVMMGPNCYILSINHSFIKTDVPMNVQGYDINKKRVIFEDDIWIGRNVTILPGRYISKGTIIGACCLLCKDFPPYSIVGGNPSILIKSRIAKNN